MYWVEVKRFGIWRKCKGSEGSEDHAVEYKNDMEYFEVREGLKQYRYRIRCDLDRFSLRRWKPYELVFGRTKTIPSCRPTHWHSSIPSSIRYRIERRNGSPTPRTR